MFCHECGAQNEDDSIFCQECGAQFNREETKPLIPKVSEITPDVGIVGKVERSVYFKIARGFTWFVIFIATIVLIFSLINFGEVLSSLYLKKSNVVTRDDVLSALEQKNKRTHSSQISPEGRDNAIDINLLNKLNTEIYNTINFLFTKDALLYLSEQEYEMVRKDISEALTHWKDFNNRIIVIKEIREKVKGIGKTKEKIEEAIGTYIGLKIQMEDFAKNSLAEKYVELKTVGIIVMSTLIFISLATISLVLMAIERNTRKIGYQPR